MEKKVKASTNSLKGRKGQKESKETESGKRERNEKGRGPMALEMRTGGQKSDWVFIS